MQRIIPILVLAAVPLFAQYQPQRTTRTRGLPNSIGDTGAYHDPAATMHGVLKRLTAKAVTIIGDGDQSVEIVRTHKTRFLRNGKEIKPADILIGSILSIDVAKAPDLTPLAVNVMVDSPPIDGALAPKPKPARSGTEMDQEEPVTAAPAPAPSDAKPPASNSSDPQKPMDQEEPIPPAAAPSKPPSR
jgi:hypothetical protein